MTGTREWTRPANSGEGEILSRCWLPQGAPRAVLQVAHGMAEHSARYDHFARYLAEGGFAVYMNDHAGHGPKAVVQGHFADDNGWEHVLGDMKALMDEAAGEWPGLPLFLMGHSMGSFLARSYIVRQQGLAGCVLSGTMGPNPALGLGRALASLQMKIRGPRSTGKLLQKISSGGNNKRIENPVSESAWLSTQEEVVRAYDADPHSGFAFTAAGYHDLFTGLAEVNGPDWPGRVPQDLPLYLFAGEEDPVGDYGEGVRRVYQNLVDSGHSDVELKLYPGGRHEMLNEAERDEVYADTLAWLERHLPPAP